MSDDLKEKLKIDLPSIAEKSFRMQQSMKENKYKDPKLRKMTVILDDENTALKTDGKLTCENDIQMHNNLIFGILVNLGTAYMMNLHFKEAQTCFEEACIICQTNSIMFYRWSQSLAYDEISSIEKLLHSRELLKKAMECFSKEKIFKEQGKLVLKMLNLHNAAEAFEYHRNFIESQIRHKEKETSSAIGDILEQAASRCSVEDDLIAEGKLPANRLDTYQKAFIAEMTDDDKKCFILTDLILAKCRDLIVFNVETMNDPQLKFAKKEFTKVAKIAGRLAFIRDLPIQTGEPLCDEEAEKLDIKIDSRMQHKAWRVKMDMISEEYGKANFNYQLFTAVLQSYLEAQRKKEEKKNDRKERGNLEDHDEKVRDRSWSSASNLACYLVSILLIILAFLLMIRAITGSNLSLYNLGLSIMPFTRN